MNEILIPKHTTSLETQNWLDKNIVIPKDILNEAIKYGIRPFTKTYWVYVKHRDYEKYGKFKFCFAGADRIAEELSSDNMPFTVKQVTDCYSDLIRKGAIKHIWCDQKIYRNKDRVYVSQQHLDFLNIQIDVSNLVVGKPRKLQNAIQKGAIPYILSDLNDISGKSDNISGKSDNISGKSDLNYILNNNIYNNSLVNGSENQIDDTNTTDNTNTTTDRRMATESSHVVAIFPTAKENHLKEGIYGDDQICHNLGHTSHVTIDDDESFQINPTTSLTGSTESKLGVKKHGLKSRNTSSAFSDEILDEALKPENDEVKRTFRAWWEMRNNKNKNANTLPALLLAIKKLSKFDDKTKIEMLEQSIFYGWRGLFPIKSTNRNYHQYDKTESDIQNL